MRDLWEVEAGVCKEETSGEMCEVGAASTMGLSSLDIRLREA